MKQDDAIVRETMEWANLWWSHADDLTRPRVLLVGDSIAVGYSNIVMSELDGLAYVDRLGSSRAVNDPCWAKELAYMLGEYEYAAIHFNNGLHGQHLDTSAYARHLRRIVQMLLTYKRGAKLIWAGSTPITVVNDTATLDPVKNAQVVQRNDAAMAVMREYDIPVNDLYQLTLGKAEWRSPDGYHYTAEAQVPLGRAVASVLRSILHGI